MARIPVVDPASASGEAATQLAAVKGKLGLVPNMTKVMANSPAVLGGYLALSGELGKGRLPAKVREQIAIVVAEVNACTYCLSAHSAIGKTLGLSPTELAAARDGDSADAKSAAALRFAQAVLDRRGEVSEEDVRAVRKAGWSDGEIAEIVGAVALNVFTNFFNKAFDVEVDFPKVVPQTAGAR